VKTVVRSGLDAVSHTFYLKPNGDSYLVDWDATMGQWPVPFKTFKALGTSQPIMVRVEAELSDYFNFGYGKNEYVSIELRHLNSGAIHGYIDLRHEDCEPLVGHLYDGKSHRIIVEIFPERHETSHELITRFVSDSWVMLGPEGLTTSD
jgi:hypothetical protein